MKKSFRSFLFAIAAGLCLSAGAEITISSGSTGLTNHAVIENLKAVCAPKGVKITNQEAPGGSPQNISRIIANDATAGVVQLDVLKMKGKSQNLDDIKVLFPLHREQVHIIVPVNSGIKDVGGFAGFGQKERVFGEWADLRGYPIGAIGGSIYTAEALMDLGGWQEQIIRVQSSFADNKALVEAVKAQKIAAAVIVAGAGNDFIKSLNKNEVRLLPLDIKTRDAAVKFGYEASTISYENLSTKGFDTVQIGAMLAVYNFTDKEIVNELNTLRTCFYENVEKVSQTRGMHQAWRTVPKSPNAKVAWDIFGK